MNLCNEASAKETTAVFIGHSDCFALSEKAVDEAVIKLINKNVTSFLSGGQDGFDRMCAGCVYRLKAKHPQIKNFLVIPYLNFNIFNKDIFDEIIFPDDLENTPYKATIPKRNDYMIKNAKYAVCYVNHLWGGAGKTYEKALKKKLNIINLGSFKDKIS